MAAPQTLTATRAETFRTQAATFKARLDAKKAALCVAKKKYNQTGQVPQAIVREMVDFVCEVYGSLDASPQPISEWDALPTKVVRPPRVTPRTVAEGILPDPLLFAAAGGGSPVTLQIVDFRAVGAQAKCPQCGSGDTNVLGVTITESNMLGVDVLVHVERNIYTTAAIGECQAGCVAKVSGHPLRFRHDNGVTLSKFPTSTQLWYPVDPSNAQGKYRPARNLFSFMSDVTLASDSGAATLLKSLSVAAAEQRSLSHLAYIEALVSFRDLAEQIVGNAAWNSLDGDERASLHLQRDALLRIKRHDSFLAFDGSPGEAGAVPLDADTVQRWLENQRETILPFRRQEIQRIAVGADDVMSLDGCVSLGRACQGKGGAERGTESVIVVAKQQIIAATVVDSKSAEEVVPMLQDGATAGWVSKLFVVDDMSEGGTGPSWHAQGDKLKAALPSVKKVVQDLMHQEARVRQTQQIFHSARPNGTVRLKRCYTHMPMDEYNRLKLMASTPAGTPGGFDVRGSLRVCQTPAKQKQFRKGDALSPEAFDSLFMGKDGKPNGLFELAFMGSAEPKQLLTPSIKVGLGEFFQWSAGAVVGHCGSCEDCSSSFKSTRCSGIGRKSANTNSPRRFPCRRHHHHRPCPRWRYFLGLASARADLGC